MRTVHKAMRWAIALSATVLLSATFLTQRLNAQDQDDPPGRVARLAYLQGSVSFEPAGESEWVQAVPNRPMTTGDKIWADKDSRAQIELGSAVIYLNTNTGVSLLNLDDRTAQIELSAGTVNVRVRQLDRDDVFEIDTPNQAFSVLQPGRYRVEASEDGSYTVVSVRDGEGESTGNGQTYTVHAGQRATFQGTNTLNAQVEDLSGPDDFDNWSYGRDRRYDDSRSARYCSRDVVGYEDLDDNGDWQPASGYGDVWFPHVASGWAPYREGHWAWIDPWGWTWVDDESWGYAPFHYGRWLWVENRWGWVPGPMVVAPVYAPALVVFVGGAGGFGGNVGWFPLGPREVYVPSYGVSRNYINRVNVSNTTVNTTTITNVYNTTIVNKSTTINNVTYVNRNVAGAVTAVPQHAFVSAQPVARAAVAVNTKEIASAPVSSRAAVAPTSNSVFGAHANTANRASAPPAAVVNRQVIAKATPPPPSAPFAARQQALAAHPGQPVPRQELQRMQAAAKAPPMVKQAPPGKPATPTTVARGAQPGNPSANQPANRPGNPPANGRPGANPPNNQPAPNNRPEMNRPLPAQPAPNSRPSEPPARSDRPPSAQPNNRPEMNRPLPAQPAPNSRPSEPPARSDRPPSAQPNNRPEAAPNHRPAEPPARNDHPPSAQPNNRPEANPREPNNRPEPNRPESNTRPAEPPARNDRPPSAQPSNPPESNPPREPQRNETAARPSNPPPQHAAPPPESRPAQRAQPNKPAPEEKKRPEEPHKNDQRPQG
jgi:hypothetical protein